MITFEGEVMTNAEIAQRLWAEARRLDRRDNLFRVRAYRQAAEVVSWLRIEVVDLLDERGRAALEELPGIGYSLSRTIEALVRTGEWIPEMKMRRVA